MDVLIATVAQRPDLARLLDDFNVWPRFMRQDPIGSLYYVDAVTAYPEFVLAAVDRAEPDRLVAKGYSVPFTWDEDPATTLPEDGWDGVVIEATLDRLAGRRGNLVSALEISIRPDLPRPGDLRVDGLRHVPERPGAGVRDPGRPGPCERQAPPPGMSIEDYAALTREDGLPVDPWLRVHVRAGGTVVGVAARAMAMAGSLAEWREWTGLPFDASGPVVVPEALVPVLCDVAQDFAAYVEPCIWVHHRLG